jgi:PilZ domain
MPEQINRRRSERVVLRIAVNVVAENEERQKMRLQAETQVVNAHGGLMRMREHLHVGQSFLLSNPLSLAEVSCRVVRIDEDGMEFYNVAFEFDRPAGNFWPVTFPPSDWAKPEVESKQLRSQAR